MSDHLQLAQTLELLIDTDNLDAEKWLNFPEYGFRQYFLWKNAETGASIALLEYAKGGRIPIKHTHASNQFMYCLKGDYEYTDVGLRLRPGSFYMNPKDHPHGPTIAHEASVLIEIYDGPHYHEKPVYHSDETISGFLSTNTDSK
ncbi:MAG: cupin domain-containing protein [Betaproteobacteria bacterium]|nr:cupin domain-containing protein [Betaproteobacteria bacterium]